MIQHYYFCYSGQYTWEMKAKVAYDGAAAKVLWIENLKGKYFYGFFDAFCKPEVFNSKQSFMQFYLLNQDNGWSVGPFETIDEINKELKSISEFGLF